VTLRIWLPPQYDPASGAQAGIILQERLDEFTSRYPDVSVEVRIKAEHGPGGLLDSLAASSAAAPLALPDLVALSYEDLQAAALKGLLHPYDGLTNTMTEADWYDYALDMAILQNSTFGLPFAGDAQVLVYRPEVIEEPPHNWATTLQAPGALVFPAADPLALFTLAQYQANGGEIRDEEGRPFLDEGTLTEVLTFYQQAEAVEVMPFWLTQFQSNEQVWEAFLEDRTDMVVTWASSYLNEKLINSAVDFYPTPNGRPYSLSTGWVWALATANPEHHELSVRLAEFLTDSNFLAEWTEALGYLPPRPSSLRAWSETASDPVLERVSSSAVLLPTVDLLSSLGPPLERATVDVLKQQSDPAAAAQSAIDSLVEP
jgi:ABC-type glycerol-3-phosphate transport system substrate-binding protein